MQSSFGNLCGLLLVCCLLRFQIARGSGSDPRQVVLELGRQNAEHQECVDNMYLSDINGDFLLSEDEYLLFIARQSEGQILVEDYRDLPFSLITHFVYGACFCSIIFQTPNCCVGAEAQINLNPDLSPFIEDNLVTICVSVGDAIDDAVGPTPPISTPPVPAPSNPPTTLAPIPSPTIAPTPQLTNATASPSSTPSTPPTIVGSASPTVLASSAPTVVESAPPTVLASSAPTMLTASPTAAPTMIAVPTSRPTPEGLTCVSFQYGIGNSDGFTAEDIFNEIDNTLKTGLILATRNVTIETLNTTYPRDGRRLKQDRPRSLTVPSNNFYVANLVQFESIGDSGGTRAFEALLSAKATGSNNFRRRTAYLPSLLNDASVDNRRLVFYTDDFMPVINAMFPNPLCDDLPEFECSVVDSTVCVLLEEGDDEEEVRSSLLAGIEQSILGGSFQAAIPPEHQLPGGIA